MEKELDQHLEAVVSHHLEGLTFRVKDFVVENDLKGKLRSGCSSSHI